MRYLRYLGLIVIGLTLLSFALANIKLVELSLFPLSITNYVGYDLKLEAPLFVVVFVSVAVGLLIGFFGEWLRTLNQRLTSRKNRRETVRLEQEISKLKSVNNSDQDDVLSLIDKVS